VIGIADEPCENSGVGGLDPDSLIDSLGMPPPAGAWQSAEPSGEFTLVSCIVMPGFEFAGSELAPPGWQPG
jgi:Cupin superfamily (DUF985)